MGPYPIIPSSRRLRPRTCEIDLLADTVFKSLHEVGRVSLPGIPTHRSFSRCRFLAFSTKHITCSCPLWLYVHFLLAAVSSASFNFVYGVGVICFFGWNFAGVDMCFHEVTSLIIRKETLATFNRALLHTVEGHTLHTRFRLSAAIADETGTATVTIFDTVAKQLLEKEASDLVTKEKHMKPQPQKGPYSKQ
ncbi:hypothetical protein L1987_85497 [Smallanthus sonchifolius]|uniref:Uncharacterized protein n=1 Tax=Smallanthus sonchifolius TaxID=185202 RepID=A0ACB8XWW7_9ASTR|nr:hypothetical protein L1987_85497 [Smallanthus sonchifolius]